MYNYNLIKEKDKPLYESLYEYIKNDILSGRLRSNDKLASKREMAIKNNISLTTVINAYNHLLMEGYIVSKEKIGYFVSDIKSMPNLDMCPIKQKDKLLYKEDKWFADFKSNNTLYHYFPFSTWKKVIRFVLNEYEEKLIERGHPFGNRELREEIASYIYKSRGIYVSPELIVIGAGIEFLYNRLISILLKTSIYAIENPGYKKISKIYEAYNLKWKSVDMDESGISMDDLLKSKADIVHVSPEHHYPLGTLMPMKRRQELLSWADKKCHYIIEDDFDCEFRYGTKPVPALKSMDVNGKVIYMNTFSKTLSPAIRISYMVLPEKLMEIYLNTTNFFTNSTSTLEQLSLTHFIKKGYFERHLNRIKKQYQKEGETLREILKSSNDLPIKQISEGNNGTHILVELNTKLSDSIIKERAANLGINVAFLSDYCTKYDKKYDHTMILNFSDLNEKTQKEAVKRLGKIFR